MWFIYECWGPACSLGAALGPLLTSYLSQSKGGFDNVFYMLYASSLAAAVLLSRLVIIEVPIHPAESWLSVYPRLACATVSDICVPAVAAQYQVCNATWWVEGWAIEHIGRPKGRCP